jgi:hypothetical protein
MSPEKFKESLVPFMPDIHNYITGLTSAQALKLYQYEQDTGNHESETHHFSFWEGMDFRWHSLKTILTSDQLEDYENYQREVVEEYSKNLVESDARLTNDIGYEKEWLVYHEKVFHPAFFKHLDLFDGLNTSDALAITNPLKIEYKKYLRRRRSKAIVSHFRHYRSLAANELTLRLLSLQTEHFWPNYACLASVAEPDILNIANAIYNEFNFLYPAKKEFVEKQLSARRDFYNLLLQKKHSNKEYENYLQELKVWEGGQENSDKYKFMSLLLMDKGKYGRHSENEIDLDAHPD